MPESHVRRVSHSDAEIKVPVDVQDSYIQVPVDIQGQYATLDVDVLATESGASGEIDTSTETSPVTVLTPSSGRKLDVRGVYIATDSIAGEIEVRFPTSGILLGKVYCAVHKAVTLQQIRFQGAADESIHVSWTGLSTGAKIFYAIRYKEV